MEDFPCIESHHPWDPTARGCILSRVNRLRITAACGANAVCCAARVKTNLMFVVDGPYTDGKCINVVQAAMLLANKKGLDELVPENYRISCFLDKFRTKKLMQVSRQL